MCETAGNVAALAAKCKNCRRGRFIVAPRTERDQDIGPVKLMIECRKCSPADGIALLLKKGLRHVSIKSGHQAHLAFDMDVFQGI
jgi:hypothetical protein